VLLKAAVPGRCFLRVELDFGLNICTSIVRIYHINCTKGEWVRAHSAFDCLVRPCSASIRGLPGLHQITFGFSNVLLDVLSYYDSHVHRVGRVERPL